MKITFQLKTPKLLKGFFVYERINYQNTNDENEEAIVLFTEELSSSISYEPFDIEKYPDVNISNFSFDSFHSWKKVNLVFQCFYKKEVL
jgi:hypothetical protein